MSQAGTFISVAPWTWGNSNIVKIWQVQYSYQLDAGGIGRYWFLTGLGGITDPGFGGTNPVMPFWASASDVITISPNPPGTTNPVTLPCPDIIRRSAFGV